MKVQTHNTVINGKVVATVVQEYYYFLWIKVTTKVTVITHRSATVELIIK